MYINNLHDDVFLHNSMLTMYMDIYIYIYPLCFLYADHHHDDNHDNHDNNDYDCSMKILDE